MHTMKFSGIARLNIMNILNGDKARGKPLDPEFKKMMALYEKIYISDEYQEEHLSRRDAQGNLLTQDGLPTLDPVRLRDMEVHTVELDHNDLTKLEDKLKEFDARPADVKGWLGPILEQLEEAKKPTIQSEADRQTNLAQFRAQNQKKAGRAG